MEEGSAGVKRLKEFIKAVEGFKRLDLRTIEYKRTKEIMGTTWNLLVLDLFEQLKPNDIGRLIETVSGGGLILLLAPPFRKWENTLTEFQKRLVTPPYTERDVKNRFIKRFIRKLFEHQGIWIVDLEKELINGRPLKPIKGIEKRIKIPEKPKFNVKLYKMAKSQDQIEVLKLIEPLMELNKKKSVLVITANRGRGKSAIIGIGLAGIISEWRKANKRIRIIITAPEPSNVKVLFEFLMKALNELEINYTFKKSEEHVTTVKVDKITVKYMKCYEVPAKKRDLVIVDEAAGIPVPMLFRILNQAKKVIYSSTIHGYEGAGRGFSVRFLRSLREFKRIDLKTFQMTEPIRYSPVDPIEKWLYDVLLLDAEPVTLTDEEKSLDVARIALYYVPDLDEWYAKKGEHELRDFIGIYVLAHYRNRPDDLAILADAPHHTARALKLQNGKIIASLQLTYEGNLSNELIAKTIEENFDTPGQLIPNVILKHYFLAGFGKLKGVRIVRIAVHPELMDRGLGSKALSGVEMEAKLHGLDWIGASFGASRLLLNFWLKNGFIPVHISPKRNPISGEYSVIVLKPLTEEAWVVIKELNKLLRQKIVEALMDVYFYLEPQVARLLLKFGREKAKMIELNRVQEIKLKMYTTGKMIYEAAADAVRLLVKKYFLEGGPTTGKLSEKDEILLISKCLQGKGWVETAEILKISTKKVKKRLREIVGKLYKLYYREGTVKDRLMRKGEGGVEDNEVKNRDNRTL